MPGRPVTLAFTAAFALGCARESGRAPSLSPPPYASSPPPSAWASGSSDAAAAVAFASARLGAPYCWGGAGPRCYDCSGLTHTAWLAAGRAIPRTSSEQAALLPPVPMDQIKPGDILWRPGHVGLYVGQGWVIAAPGTGDVVRYQPARAFVRAVRP